jgi:hypothetical protein
VRQCARWAVLGLPLPAGAGWLGCMQASLLCLSLLVLPTAWLAGQGSAPAPATSCHHKCVLVYSIVRVCVYPPSGALSYLHSHGVIHGDLTPSNILMASATKDARRWICKASQRQSACWGLRGS